MSWSSLSERDRRALMLLAGALVVIGAIYWFTSPPSSTTAPVAATTESVDRLEQRLAKMRQAAATVPAKEHILKQVNGELAQREKGLIQADTAAQAEARLVQILREVAKNQQPPIDIRQIEQGPVKPYGDAYGAISVSITMDCRTDQLTNFMAFLTAQPELIATEEMRIGTANPKFKTMPVRLTVAGLVAKKLIPQKKGITLL